VHRYIAFLRVINLGNRRIKMDRLRGDFTALKFDEVKAFIASGNVLFSSPQPDAPKLETAGETHLLKTLAFTVVTDIRIRAEDCAFSSQLSALSSQLWTFSRRLSVTARSRRPPFDRRAARAGSPETVRSCSRHRYRA